MNRQPLVMVLCFAAGIGVAALAALWLREPAPAPTPMQPVSPPIEVPKGLTQARPDPDDPLVIPADQIAALTEIARRMEAKEVLDARGRDEAPPPPAPNITYAVADKLVGTESMSEVPYDVVGAWDEAPESDQMGSHRSFVLVVEEGLSEQQLESLALDVWERHQDADRLSVRIFDRADAAIDSRQVDGGAYAARHTVAEINRHRGLKVDVIRVRGRIVEP